jgi:hypothetical protein
MPVCVRACVFVCVYVCVCVRVCACFNLLTSVSQTWRLASSEHAPIVIASLNINFLCPLQLELWKSVHPVVCLHGAANFPSAPLLGPGPSRHNQKRILSTSMLLDDVRGAERRAASSSYQTLSHFFPQHCSLHPWSPKLVCPDKQVFLDCLPGFRPGRWLCGSGQTLSLNFYKTRSGVRPAAPPPAPPLPLTPQGCLICKFWSLCKFRGRGVRWVGLRRLV